jgi:uncharacterized protein YndB with AHSA1/START domain
MTEQATAAAHQSVTVPLGPERAFELFTDRFDEWWPHEGTHSLTEAESFVLEPRPDGRWGELASDGSFQPWGRVLAVDRPNRILLAWQLTPDFGYDPDPGLQTEVEVTFAPEGDGTTRVTLEHRGFEVWGEKGAAMRESVSSEGGWRGLLERYSAQAAP